MFRIVLCLVCVVSAGLVQADTFRCGTRLILDGDSKAQVLLRCGEPLTKSTVKILNRELSRQITEKSLRFTQATTDTTTETIVVMRWTYNPGKGQFLRLLTFYGDVLESIELGDRVE